MNDDVRSTLERVRASLSGSAPSDGFDLLARYRRRRQARQRIAALAVGVIVAVAGTTIAVAAFRGAGGLRSSPQGGLAADGLVASCGGVRFTHLPPDTSTFTPFASFDELDLARLEGEAPFFEEFVGNYDWVVAEQAPDRRMLFGQPAQDAATDPPYAYALLELRQGRWAPVGWGQCRIELDAEGWGNAGFVLDPAVRPDPDADRISVLAAERACAGGQAPVGREVRAVILDENDETVSIVILVEPPEGDQNCPGNPSFVFEVDLGSPLGDREVLDASTYPPVAVWPSE